MNDFTILVRNLLKSGHNQIFVRLMNPSLLLLHNCHLRLHLLVRRRHRLRQRLGPRRRRLEEPLEAQLLLGLLVNLVQDVVRRPDRCRLFVGQSRCGLRP